MWFARLKNVYKAPTKSNELLPTAYSTGPTHVGLADSQELLDEAAGSSKSAEIANSKKIARRKSIENKAATTGQLIDSKVQEFETGMQKRILKLGNTMTLREGCNAKGYNAHLSFGYTNVRSPPEQGCWPSGEQLCKRPKMTITTSCLDSISKCFGDQFLKEQQENMDVVIVDNTAPKMPNEMFAESQAKLKQQSVKENSAGLQTHYADSLTVRHLTVRSLPWMHLLQSWCINTSFHVLFSCACETLFDTQLFILIRNSFCAPALFACSLLS